MNPAPSPKTPEELTAVLEAVSRGLDHMKRQRERALKLREQEKRKKEQEEDETQNRSETV